MSGTTVSGVALARDNTKVVLTLSTPMSLGTGYTVTMTNLTTASGDQLPASQVFTFSYATLGSGSMLWQCYGNIGNSTAVSALTSASSYPNQPTQTIMETSFEAPHNTGNIDYGERLSGYLDPPTTGYYIFTIASSDQGQLWLSTNNNPANVQEIASVSTYTGYRDWSNANNPTQTSVPIYLSAGQPYYVMALEKQGGASGGDNLSVRWEIPATTGGNASTWELNSSGVVDSTIPIPGIRLSPPSTILDPSAAAWRASAVLTSGVMSMVIVMGAPFRPSPPYRAAYPSVKRHGQAGASGSGSSATHFHCSGERPTCRCATPNPPGVGIEEATVPACDHLDLCRQTADATSGGITGVQEGRQVLIFRPQAHRRTTSCHRHASGRGLARRGEGIRESLLTFCIFHLTTSRTCDSL